MRQFSEQELVRREKAKELESLGIDPFGHSFEVTSNTKEIREEFGEKTVEELDEISKEVIIAGRIMTKRGKGKAGFINVQDKFGQIQIYVKIDNIGEESYNIFKKSDIGDIVGITGTIMRTHMGELSIRATKYEHLVKSLRPLPEKFHGLVDTEERFRRRYVDLIMNEEARRIAFMRPRIIRAIQHYLDNLGFVEVETPILGTILGGAAARPFVTHHNTLDMDLYLRIADELYLKKLIVGGYAGVYEFSKDFRNEGMDRFHNPEFTQMELYVAYKDYFWMMNTVEEMVERIALALHGTTKVKVGENIIDFKRPWKRYTMYEAIEHFTGIDISDMDEQQLRETATKLNVPIDETMGKGKLIDEIFGETCEGKLIQPTFIYDYPIEMSPLAKKHRSKEGLVERFEAVCNCKEICNAYSELNDPIDQRKRFEEQLELGKRGDPESMVLDEDFLRAIEFGMPPTSGLGIGIDRLAMMMTDSNSIQDVLFFPQMKPEVQQAISSDDDFKEKGIPEEWIDLLRKAGIGTLENLKSANINKLFNDLNGLRKKNKLQIPALKLEELKSWAE